jgi:succinate dehydrogenase hydrophobic anchor subunit
MRNIQVFVFCNSLCISNPTVSLVTAVKLQAKKCKTAALLICSLKKLQGFLRSNIAGQFWSLKQLSLLSLPLHKSRVCHVVVTDSVNYRALRRVLQCVWFISNVVKIVYIFQKSKWEEVNSDKQAHWDHTCVLRSDFRKRNGLKPVWYPP